MFLSLLSKFLGFYFSGFSIFSALYFSSKISSFSPSFTPIFSLRSEKGRDEEKHTERHGNVTFAKMKINNRANPWLQSNFVPTDVTFHHFFTLPNEINELLWCTLDFCFVCLFPKILLWYGEVMLHTIKSSFSVQASPQYWPWQLWVPLQESHCPVFPTSPPWICLWLYAFYLSLLLWWSMLPSTTTQVAGNQTVLRRKSR